MVDNRRGTSTTTNVAVSKKRKMEFPPAAIDHRRPDTRTRIRTKRDVAGGGYQYHHKVLSVNNLIKSKLQKQNYMKSIQIKIKFSKQKK
jgi:hypothetical protein